jgi:carbon monoxide dehydrogenase subunit G
MRFENSVAIDRPVEEVFEYLTIIENLADWMGPIVEAKQTSPNPVTLGSTGEVKAKFLGRRMEVPTEITAWNPPQSFSAHNAGGPFPITFHYTLTSEGGGTRVSVITEAEPGGFFRVAAPVLEQLVKRQAHNDLETLKALLESPQ